MLAGFDPHLDGPVEPLHTVLLGVVKYAWGLTCKEIDSNNNLPLFEARLASVSTDGLSIPPIRAQYLVQYRGSLIGRQFKQIMQVISFVLHELVSEDIQRIWITAGAMVSLMWFTEIEDINEYLVCPSVLNYLKINESWFDLSCRFP